MAVGKTRKKLNAKASRNTGGGGSGTVTSVSRTLGTTGTDVSLTITNPTTTPNIDLQLPTASDTNRGLLSAADWSLFNSQIKRLVTITKGVAEVMQTNSTAVPGQWYRVTETAGASIVADQIKCIILVGNEAGKFGIQAWAELITSKGNFYSACSFDSTFKLGNPHGIADLWVARLSQASGDPPTIYLTELNNLSETPTFTYDSTGIYTIELTGDQFKSDDIFIPSYQTVKMVDSAFSDAATYVSVEFVNSARAIIKTYFFDKSSGVFTLSDDILNRTVIRLQRFLSSTT